MPRTRSSTSVVRGICLSGSNASLASARRPLLISVVNKVNVNKKKNRGRAQSSDAKRQAAFCECTLCVQSARKPAKAGVYSCKCRANCLFSPPTPFFFFTPRARAGTQGMLREAQSA